MERKWYQSYDKEVKKEVDLDKYDNLPHIFDEMFHKYPDKDAFISMGHSITFRETDEQSNRLANYLTNELKLKKGDRVGIMMPNCLQYPLCLFAVLKAGLVVVNINPLYTPRELEYQLNDAGVRAIFAWEPAMKTLETCLSKTAVEHIICTKLGDLLPFPKGFIINSVIKYVKKMVPKWDIPNVIWFNDTLKNMSPQFEKPAISQDCNAFLQYTGGTTGVSKGAILTHRNILANIQQSLNWYEFKADEGQEIVINALPLSHIFSLVAICFCTLIIGGVNVLITNPRDIDTFVGVLSKIKFTNLSGVNTLFKKIMDHPNFSKIDTSDLKYCVSGGMATEEAVAKRWEKHTGTILLEGYGLTECSPTVLFNPINNKEFSGMTGLPLPQTDVQIRDEFGKEMPEGEIGEICVSGPQVMKGYWNHEEETKKVFHEDGYLRTGDMAYMDARGYVKIVDRGKDMILVSGFNVYPTELENVITKHPKVFEAAAIGVPDESTGEAIKLIVVKHDEDLTEEELRAFCKENLTNYKIPKIVEFRKEELPKTPVGKILKRALREEEEKKRKS